MILVEFYDGPLKGETRQWRRLEHEILIPLARELTVQDLAREATPVFEDGLPVGVYRPDRPLDPHGYRWRYVFSGVRV